MLVYSMRCNESISVFIYEESFNKFLHSSPHLLVRSRFNLSIDTVIPNFSWQYSERKNGTSYLKFDVLKYHPYWTRLFWWWYLLMLQNKLQDVSLSTKERSMLSWGQLVFLYLAANWYRSQPSAAISEHCRSTNSLYWWWRLCVD